MEALDLKIKNVYGKGDLEKECIVLEATDHIGIKDYILYDNTFKGDGTPSNEFRHLFRFPVSDNYMVNKGDLIYIFTRSGTDRNYKDGLITKHIFYWNSNHLIWNRGGDIVHLAWIMNEDWRAV